MLPWTLPVRGRESIKRLATDSTKGSQTEGSGVHRLFLVPLPPLPATPLEESVRVRRTLAITLDDRVLTDESKSRSH